MAIAQSNSVNWSYPTLFSHLDHIFSLSIFLFVNDKASIVT